MTAVEKLPDGGVQTSSQESVETAVESSNHHGHRWSQDEVYNPQDPSTPAAGPTIVSFPEGDPENPYNWSSVRCSTPNTQKGKILSDKRNRNHRKRKSSSSLSSSTPSSTPPSALPYPRATSAGSLITSTFSIKNNSTFPSPSTSSATASDHWHGAR